MEFIIIIIMVEVCNEVIPEIRLNMVFNCANNDRDRVSQAADSVEIKNDVLCLLKIHYVLTWYHRI